MLHGSTGRGSAAAPVSEPPTPVAAAPASITPRPSSARRSMRPLPATSDMRDASVPCVLVIFVLPRGIVDHPTIFRRPWRCEHITFHPPFHQPAALNQPQPE